MRPWPDLAFAALLYASCAALVLGAAWRLARWLRTPQPRRVPVTPAPRTVAGVCARMVHETLFFTTLWRASPWTWLLGWTFHVGLALVLLQHLRYVTAHWWGWVSWLSAYGHLASALLLAGLAGLWARRLLVDRIRWITRPSDHAVLALIAGVALTGVIMKYVAPADVVAVKAFVRGLVTARPEPLPGDAILLAHVLLAAALIAVFPFGKLMHGPGLWVNPTRAQADDARERARPRHG